MQRYLDNLGEKFICRDVRLVAQFFGCGGLPPTTTMLTNTTARNSPTTAARYASSLMERRPVCLSSLRYGRFLRSVDMLQGLADNLSRDPI